MKEYKNLSERVQEIEELEAVEPTPEVKAIREQCVKCGWYEADMKYYGDRVEVQDTVSGSLSIQLKSKTQYMLLTCLRCGYERTVSPLDDLEHEKGTNLDNPGRHNVSGSMNRPAGVEK